MKNIKTKQVSLSNWKEEIQLETYFDSNTRGVSTKGGLTRQYNKPGKLSQSSLSNERKSKNPKQRMSKKEMRKSMEDDANYEKKMGRSKPTPSNLKTALKKQRGVKKEHVEGGINVQNVADGLNFTEIETVDIIKTKPIKGASNWKLEMVVETLISEGYTDEEILLEVDRNQGLGAWALGKGIEYTLGGIKNTINVVRNTPSTVRNVVTTAKKHYQLGKHLRNPENLSKVTRTTPKSTNTGGGLVKSFKGFMQNIKDAGSNIVNRTKGKLNRTDIKTNTPTTTKKPVEVLGGAATNPTTTVKPMKNITPSSIGDKITNVTDKIKVAGAGTAGATLGAASTKLSPSKVSTADTGETTGTELKGDKPLSTSIRGEIKKNQPTEIKKVEAPITNDGKKEVNPSKNEKITTTPKKSGGRPFNVDRGKTVDRVYGAQIAQTRKLKGDAAADKQRKKFMTRPVTSLEMDEGMDNMGGPAALGAVLTTTVGLGKAAYDGIKKTADNLKKNKEEKQQKLKNLTQSYSWRDELNLQEMGAYQGGGTMIKTIYDGTTGRPSGFKQIINRTKEVPLTPTQNRMLVKNKTKTTTVG